MTLRKLRILGLGLMLVASPSQADQGTIVGPTTGPKTMTEVMGVLNAALLAIQSCNSGSSSPANGVAGAPTEYQCWADTSAAPDVSFKYYDGASWVTFGTLNTSTHVWTPYRNGAAIAAIATTGSASDLTTGTLPTARIAANDIANAKLATMGNGTTKCRTTAGTGDPEDCSASQMRSLLSLVVGSNVQAWDADLDAFALKTAPSGAVVGSTDSQTLTNKTMSGSSNTFSAIPFTAMTGQATLSQLPTLGANTLMGSIAGGTPAALSQAQATALMNSCSATLNGVVPAAGSSTGKVLRDDCTWITVSGTGTVTSVSAGAGMSFSTITGTGSVAIDKASGSDLRAGTSNKVLAADNIFDSQVAITYAASQTLDFSTFLNGSVALTGNITSLTCSNIKASQSGVITFTQDATGSRTMVAGWCSQFRWANGTRGVLSTAANAVDELYYQCKSSSVCNVSLAKGMAN